MNFWLCCLRFLREKIYKKYAGGILEYAAKFGGLTEGVVRKRLRLEKYVCDKPMLKRSNSYGGDS